MVLYQQEQGRLITYESEGSKADIHVHSAKPRLVIPNKTTRVFGVMESYTSVERAHKMMVKRGMDFYTLSNHDCVEHAIELRRRYEDKAFISCEYSVRVGDDSKKAIHVLCPGLDYPGEVTAAVSDSAVREIHKRLLAVAKDGHRRFREYCDSEGIETILCHGASQLNRRHRLTGAEFDDITDVFDVYEINGDMQSGNIFMAEVAIEKSVGQENKWLVADTDDHTGRRIANQYIVTDRSYANAGQFVQAIKRREFGFGSRFALPEGLVEPSIADIMMHQFNGTVAELQKDTAKGSIDWTLYEWSARKIAAVAAATAVSMGTSAGITAIAGPEYGAIPFTLFTVLQTIGFLAASWIIPRRQKDTEERMTRELYRDYHEHRFREESWLHRKKIEGHEQVIGRLEDEIGKFRQMIDDEQRSIDDIRKLHDRELPYMIKNPRRLESLLYRATRRLDAFSSDFDLSERMNKT